MYNRTGTGVISQALVVVWIWRVRAFYSEPAI
jgi:hypothetical protein